VFGKKAQRVVASRQNASVVGRFGPRLRIAPLRSITNIANEDGRSRKIGEFRRYVRVGAKWGCRPASKILCNAGASSVTPSPMRASAACAEDPPVVIWTRDAAPARAAPPRKVRRVEAFFSGRIWVSFNIGGSLLTVS